MNAREAILSRLKDDSDIDIATEAAALLGTPERPAVDIAQVEAEFLARLALPSVSASHDDIETIEELPAAVARYLDAQGEARALCLPPTRACRVATGAALPCIRTPLPTRRRHWQSRARVLPRPDR
ncbi:hypothetical protein ACFSUK_19975 [Sphingobium scionense]